MIPALLIGREGSVGFPGKNLAPLVGRPVMRYPLLAAKHARHVDRLYISTDSPRIRAEAEGLGADWIDRPPDLATRKALGEDAFFHGYRVIRDRGGKSIEMVVLLFCNAPLVLATTIDNAIEALRGNPEADSAVSVSKYNMWGPTRARRIGPDGLLHPWIPLEDFKGVTCDRDSGDDAYFADMGVSVVRPRCFEEMASALPPQRWMGRKILPVLQEGGLDIDYPFQMGQADYWLRANGFSETHTPYDRAER